MTRRFIDDGVADAQVREEREVPPPREQAALILGLQRGAGNAAVTRLLQRDGADAPTAFGGLGSARLRSFATGMPPEEAMLELMPPEMAAMLGAAREREEWGEDEEQDEADWDLPPLEDAPPAAAPEHAADEPQPASEAGAEPESLPALGGLGSASLRSFATGMPPEEAMLESMPPAMAAMVGEARRREEERPETEDEDDAVWELPPLEDVLPAATSPQAAADTGPAPEPEAPPEPLPALGELGGARLRSFATGMSAEEAQAEKDRELKEQGVLPRPTAEQEIETAQQEAEQERLKRGKLPRPDPHKGEHGPGGLGAGRRKRLEKVLGHRAANLGGDPAALAAGVQQDRRTDQQRTDDERLQKQQKRDAREKKRQVHAAYSPVRADAQKLGADIEKLPPHLLKLLPPGTAAKIEGIATGAATTELAGPRDALKKASDAVAKLEQDEAAYSSIRTKAKQILDLIDKAPAGFKSRLNPAFRDTVSGYAEGPPRPSKQAQAIHLELNKAKDDFDARENDFKLAQRSRDKLVDLKARRAVLGFIDADVDRLIAAADVDNAASDFWALQESVKPVEEAIKRLNTLEAGYQQLNRRLTYARARMGATPGWDLAQDAALTAGFTNRGVAPDPAHALLHLDTLMRSVEKPAVDVAFNNPRKAGNFATATAALGPLEAAGVIRLGNFNSAYHTSFDGDGYSVEFSIDGLPDVVIHVHCTKEGAPKDGENASHWKPKSGKFTPGVSHPITAAVRNKLIDRSVLKPRAQMTLV